ncbi:MAG: helix-turn-helix domain-containing protein [Mycobacteriales bacterium]
MTTAADLQRDLGPALVVAAAGDLTREVAAVSVSDPVHRTEPAHGDLVIAVGFLPDSLAELIVEADKAGAAAVLVKGTAIPVIPTSTVGLVVVDPAADWGHVISLTRVALSAGPVLGASPDESLFSLAEALASLCGGSVVIHDPSWQLLAYSGGEAGDQVRSATLLGRRAPRDTVEQLRAVGVIERLLQGELVHLEDGEIPGLAERYAAAITVSGQFLGTIWVVPLTGTDTQEALGGLRRAVDVAALALLRHAALGPGTTPERQVPFEALLSGAHTERLVAERLGVDLDAGFILAGLRPLAPSPTERSATARRLLSAARSYCEAYRITAMSAALADTTFVLFPAAGEEQRRAAVRVLTDMHNRLQLTAPHRTMVSSTFGTITEIHGVRPTVDDLLSLAERRGWSGLTDTEGIQATWRLEQFREVALAHPALLEGPVMRLVEHDRLNGGELLNTLRAWFQAVGDTRVSAEVLGLHVNTVRYRLKKAAEVAGLNLDNPDERLLAELQVRLLTH